MHSIWCPLTTSEGKGQSFINCSPRPRGQGGRHGLEWAPSSQRVSPRGTQKKLWNDCSYEWNQFYNCRRDLSDACRDNIHTFFRGSASRPCGPGARRLSWAAASRATATKLQIIESATVWMEPRSFGMQIRSKNGRIIFCKIAIIGLNPIVAKSI